MGKKKKKVRLLEHAEPSEVPDRKESIMETVVETVKKASVTGPVLKKTTAPRRSEENE